MRRKIFTALMSLGIFTVFGVPTSFQAIDAEVGTANTVSRAQLRGRAGAEATVRSMTPGRTVHGDPPDPANVPEELKKIYQDIDDRFQEHLERLRKWIRIPSVSNAVEGQTAVWESAKLIRDIIANDLGCKAEIHAPGLGDWGAPGHPVVYGRCDVGAQKTLIDYSMGDVMPVFRPEAWELPPFAAQMKARPPFKRVLVGRAATNHKGKDLAEINALISIKAVTGTLPVNVIFVSEHDEERMDIGLRTFMFKNRELFKDADAAFVHGSTVTPDGRGLVSGQSIGCVVFDLETSSLRPGLWLAEQPMWRHLTMVARVFADDSPLIKEISKDVLPVPDEEVAYLRREARLSGRNSPFEELMKRRTQIRVTVTGTWGGNMAPGYAGRYTPPVATSKLDIRFPPRVDGDDVVRKVRAYLDREGYGDVKMRTVGVVPWAWANAETEVAQALLRMYRQFDVPYNEPPKGDFLGTNATYYGPNYLFAREPLKLPIVMGGIGGYGEEAHSDNEWIVIEGDGKQHYGFAGAMKGFATILYNYAGKVSPAGGSSR